MSFLLFALLSGAPPSEWPAAWRAVGRTVGVVAPPDEGLVGVRFLGDGRPVWVVHARGRPVRVYDLAVPGGVAGPPAAVLWSDGFWAPALGARWDAAGCSPLGGGVPDLPAHAAAVGPAGALWVGRRAAGRADPLSADGIHPEMPVVDDVAWDLDPGVPTLPRLVHGALRSAGWGTGRPALPVGVGEPAPWELCSTRKPTRCVPVHAASVPGLPPMTWRGTWLVAGSGDGAVWLGEVAVSALIPV